MRTLLLVSALPLLAACATTGGPVAQCQCGEVRAQADTDVPGVAQALRVIDYLETAILEGDDERLGRAIRDMNALEAVMLSDPPEPVQAPSPHVGGLPPPPRPMEDGGADEDAEDAALIAQAQADWLGLSDEGAPEPDAESSPEPEPAPGGPASAPDLDGSRSLLHAVHVASYRTPEQVREGWDVQNVTTIVGLRPYTSKARILPEQTLGRMEVADEGIDLGPVACRKDRQLQDVRPMATYAAGEPLQVARTELDLVPDPRRRRLVAGPQYDQVHATM
jgi:hypothetical protein